VHFFSIPALIREIWTTNQEDKVLKPSLSTILFKNEFEKEFEYFPRRITQTLIEARTTTI
jgi:hypothetical protein